ncbi:MAG: ATP synthase subunit C [Planctomycetota bacterium]|jgi:V/A-type H+-transporting ATPase subunit K
MDEPEKRLKLHITQSVIGLLTVMAIIGILFCASSLAQTSHDEETIGPEMSSAKNDVMKYGLISAAVAFGLGAIGAGIAISYVGAAAMGAVAEKPQIAGQALIFVALAEGLVVFGFITALMILGKI